MELKPVHYLLGAAGVGIVYLLLRPKTVCEPCAPCVPPPAIQPPPPPPPPAPVPVFATSYDAAKAASVVLTQAGGQLTTSIGTSVRAENAVGNQVWPAPGVSSSNTTVLAPSDPATVNGFVAMKPGTSTLTGYVWDNNSNGTVPITATVTVLAPSA